MALASLKSRAVIGALMKAIEETQVPAWVNACSMFMTTNQETETYVWTKAIAAMRQWVGARAAKALETDEVAVTSFEYEDTLRVLRRDRALDKTGQVDLRIGELAKGAVRHWAQLLSPLQNNGDNSVTTYGAAATYDAADFFGAGHRGSQNNDLTFSAATGSNRLTGGEMVDLIMQAIEAMVGFTDEQSQPINEGMGGVHVVVPTFQMGGLVQAIRGDRIGDTIERAVGAATVGNTLKLSGFNVTGSVNPRLTSSLKVQVYRDDSAVRAMIRQEEEALALEAIAEGSEHEMKTGEHLYGVRATRGVGYGRWEHATQTVIS